MLTRSTKITDLVGNIEAEIKPDCPDKERSQRHLRHPVFCVHLRCVKDLENAVDILNAQFEAIEDLKVEVTR